MIAARAAVQATFIHLGDDFTVTSERTESYNCAGWAASEQRYWWPDGQNYWPGGVVPALSTNSFIEAFATIGFEKCTNGDIEEGFEKIALFTRDSIPTHMARQFSSGKWTSKLGSSYDIALSDLAGLTGKMGKVCLFMKRKIT